MKRKSATKSKAPKALIDDEGLAETESIEEEEEKPARKRSPGNSDDSRVYKLLDLVGTADDVEGAIQTALERASKTVRHIDWFEVKEIRGKVKDGKVDQYQVNFRAGFRLES